MNLFKKVIEDLNQEILKGLEFSNPGETEMARRESFYCSNLTINNCRDCHLTNYGRDCHNNKIDKDVEFPTGKINHKPIDIDNKGLED